MIKIDWNPPEAQLRQFGWISLIGFPLVAGVLMWLQDVPIDVLWWLSGVAVVTFVLSRIDPKLVKPIFFALMLIAIPIGFVISFVLMALIYYGMFTPFALFFRLIGRDVLHKHPDPRVPSYWHERGEPRPAASYYKMY